LQKKNGLPPKYTSRPLRICLLSYRTNPFCGGQGVYVKHLSRALSDLGHQVEIVSGPPDVCFNNDIPVHRLPSLDLYNPSDLFRTPSLKELSDPINLMEWLGVSTMGFPEPFIFGLRAYHFLKSRKKRYDIIHDNQSLSYGILAISKWMPTIATIHHPITIDRDIAVRAAGNFFKKLQHLRWYSFVGMQKRVVRRLPRFITVSKCARDDICREFKLSQKRFRIAPNGIDTQRFHPLPGITRHKNRIITTTSSDTPLKGLSFLLHAVARIAEICPIRLIVVGTPKKHGGSIDLVRKLDLNKIVRFTGPLNDMEFVREYAKATLAVIPSIYEGFGLPAAEAMACKVPVISTTGGALPEVVGAAGILVPPRDSEALFKAILDLLNHPNKAKALGQAGYQRATTCFTWKQAALKTVAAYQEVLGDYGRL
jgi:glycosyltransferase involved in cell wall biosynthesis